MFSKERVKTMGEFFFGKLCILAGGALAFAFFFLWRRVSALHTQSVQDLKAARESWQESEESYTEMICERDKEVADLHRSLERNSQGYLITLASRDGIISDLEQKLAEARAAGMDAARRWSALEGEIRAAHKKALAEYGLIAEAKSETHRHEAREARFALDMAKQIVALSYGHLQDSGPPELFWHAVARVIRSLRHERDLLMIRCGGLAAPKEFAGRCADFAVIADDPAVSCAATRYAAQGDSAARAAHAYPPAEAALLISNARQRKLCAESMRRAAAAVKEVDGTVAATPEARGAFEAAKCRVLNAVRQESLLPDGCTQQTLPDPEQDFEAFRRALESFNGSTGAVSGLQL